MTQSQVTHMKIDSKQHKKRELLFSVSRTLVCRKFHLDISSHYRDRKRQRLQPHLYWTKIDFYQPISFFIFLSMKKSHTSILSVHENVSFDGKEVELGQQKIGHVTKIFANIEIYFEIQTIRDSQNFYHFIAIRVIYT